MGIIIFDITSHELTSVNNPFTSTATSKASQQQQQQCSTLDGALVARSEKRACSLTTTNTFQFDLSNFRYDSYHTRPMNSLVHSLSINHRDQPSYNVKVANENLKRFRPHVRSESWFKISMVVYPMFISYYFSMITVIIGAIYVYFTESLSQMNEKCALETEEKIDLLSVWSYLDRLTFFETQYTVFALSFSSSFYCSYYFGTIIELHIWIQEIAQQLDLSRIVLELNHAFPRSMQVQQARSSAGQQQEHQLPVGKAAYSLTGDQINFPVAYDDLFAYHGLDRNSMDEFFNHFGGLRSVFAHTKHQLFSSQSERFKRRELIAMRLVSKRQTLLRATYINLNLFLDELHETRFMTQTILRRTTQIAFGFALMVSITRSQFASNTLYLTILLLATLAILNLYLVCAASINSSVSKIRPP